MPHKDGPKRLSIALALGLMTMGCASAEPLWTGGSTTPEHRVDIAFGGGARIVTGGLRPEEIGEESAEASDLPRWLAGGVVPVARARYGIGRHLDLGIGASGTGARLELRHEWGVVEDTTRPAWVGSLALFGGALIREIADSEDTLIRRRGARFGLEIPVAYGIDFGGIYDVWIGGVVGAEGNTTPEASAGGALGIRAGAFFGIAAGFRRVHAFLELRGDYEHWWPLAGEGKSVGGFALTPSFGIRLRI